MHSTGYVGQNGNKELPCQTIQTVQHPVSNSDQPDASEKLQSQEHSHFPLAFGSQWYTASEQGGSMVCHTYDLVMHTYQIRVIILISYTKVSKKKELCK